MKSFPFHQEGKSQIPISFMGAEQRKSPCKPRLSDFFALFRWKVVPPFSEKSCTCLDDGVGRIIQNTH